MEGHEGSAEIMRDEGAEIVSNRAARFADPDTAAFLVDHPQPEDGVTRWPALGEDGFGSERLEDLRPL